MKNYAWVTALLAICAILFVGCGKKDEVDTAKLQKTFEAADNTAQSAVNKVIVAIQSEDLPAALAELQKLAQTKLTPEQQKVVQDTIEQIKKKVGDAASKAAGELQKALPK